MQLKGFVFGVRINKSFSIEDKLGAIIDDILNHRNDSFNVSTFSKVRPGFGSKTLINNLEDIQLSINPEGIIFDCNNVNDFEEDYEVYLKAFEEIIIGDIFKKYKIRNINRFGFVVKALLDKKDEVTESIHESIASTYGNLDSLAVRFNTIKKTPQKIENVVTQDYENIIYSYDRQDKDSPFVYFVDFQKYFIPSLEISNDIRKIPEKTFSGFCNKFLSKFKESIKDNIEPIKIANG